MPAQSPLYDQLRALYALANKHGLYDAADFVRGHVEAVERKEQARQPRRSEGGQVRAWNEALGFRWVDESEARENDWAVVCRDETMRPLGPKESA